jgi:hypothetical protein
MSDVTLTPGHEAFTTMLKGAVVEGERLGWWVDIDDMDAELDDIIRSAQAER